MSMGRRWHKFNCFVFVVHYCVFDVSYRQASTIHIYFSLVSSSLSLSFPQPTHEALFVIFLIQHSTSELIFFTEMYLSKSPPSLVSLQRQNTTLYWPFHAKTTFRRCFHLIYTQSLSTRRDLQEQFDVFWRIWFSMLSSSRFFVLLTAAP